MTCGSGSMMGKINGLPREQLPGNSPIILGRFLRMYMQYRNDRVPFDLLDIMSYDPEMVDFPYTADDLEMPLTVDGLPLNQHEQWPQKMVSEFNTRRKANGLPVLAVDVDPYYGRLNADRFFALMSSRNGDRTIWDYSGHSEPSEPKLPITIPTGQDEHQIPDVAMDVDNITTDGADLTEPATHGPYTLRQRKHRTESPNKEDAHRDFDDETEDITTGEPSTKEKEGGDSGRPARIINDEVRKWLKDALTKSIGSDTTTPSNKKVRILDAIYAPKASWYEGPYLLDDGYWQHEVHMHKRLGGLQLMLGACGVCTAENSLCLVAFNISPNCVRCQLRHTSCSFHAIIDDAGGHLASPYSNTLGKRILAAQIYNMMHGRSIIIRYKDAQKVNMSPGIPRGTPWSPLTQGEKTQLRNQIQEQWELLEPGHWEDLWYGVDYKVAAEALSRTLSPNRGIRRSMKHTVLNVQESLPDDIIEWVDHYYKVLDKAQSKKNWTGESVLKHFEHPPEIEWGDPEDEDDDDQEIGDAGSDEDLATGINDDRESTVGTGESDVGNDEEVEDEDGEQYQELIDEEQQLIDMESDQADKASEEDVDDGNYEPWGGIGAESSSPPFHRDSEWTVFDSPQRDEARPLSDDGVSILIPQPIDLPAAPVVPPGELPKQAEADDDNDPFVAPREFTSGEVVPSSQESELADIFTMDQQEDPVVPDVNASRESKGKSPIISSPLRDPAVTSLDTASSREPNSQPPRTRSHTPLPLSNVSSPVRRHLSRVGDRITAEEARDLERDVREMKEKLEEKFRQVNSLPRSPHGRSPSWSQTVAEAGVWLKDIRDHVPAALQGIAELRNQGAYVMGKLQSLESHAETSQARDRQILEGFERIIEALKDHESDAVKDAIGPIITNDIIPALRASLHKDPSQEEIVNSDDRHTLPIDDTPAVEPISSEQHADHVSPSNEVTMYIHPSLPSPQPPSVIPEAATSSSAILVTAGTTSPPQTPPLYPYVRTPQISPALFYSLSRPSTPSIITVPRDVFNEQVAAQHPPSPSSVPRLMYPEQYCDTNMDDTNNGNNEDDG
ncbi:hypothetical protein QCA50_015231 [Cerrena zonata]|uniref:Uncharacterized protein n=1 Tax=Cerrena zonata TaxID=2478898 RepID=A0AAW0FR18_9APHY